MEGADGGSISIASSNKDLKQLMKSAADVVYYEKKGKLYLYENGTAESWGAKKVGALIIGRFAQKAIPFRLSCILRYVKQVKRI